MKIEIETRVAGMVFELFAQRMSETAATKERSKKTKKAVRKLHPVQHGGKLTSNMRCLPREVIISNRNLFEEKKRQRPGWVDVPHASSFPPPSSGLSVSRRTPKNRQRQREKILCGGRPSSHQAQGSGCHGHCEWKSSQPSGVAPQCLHTRHSKVFYPPPPLFIWPI